MKLKLEYPIRFSFDDESETLVEVSKSGDRLIAEGVYSVLSHAQEEAAKQAALRAATAV